MPTPENPALLDAREIARMHLTLRDLFAAAALAGLASATEEYQNDSIQSRTAISYRYAAAMMAARGMAP